MAIGDGHVSSGNVLQVVHSPKQEEYLNFKANLLAEATGKKVKVFTRSVRTKKSNYDQVGFHFYSPYLKFVRKRLYPEGKKFFTYKLLSKLTDECVALWIMDDGSLYPKKRNGVIHAAEFVLCTYCSQTEAELVSQFFKDRYDADMTLKFNKGAYSVRCGTRSARKLLPNFTNFVCDSMKYKFTVPT